MTIDAYVMPASRLERVAAAIRDAQRLPHGALGPARAALVALQYVDGADEDDLVEISNRFRVEAVTLSEALDAYLDLTARGGA